MLIDEVWAFVQTLVMEHGKDFILFKVGDYLVPLCSILTEHIKHMPIVCCIFGILGKVIPKGLPIFLIGAYIFQISILLSWISLKCSNWA